MFTEQEAKTKWCPFVRVGSETTGLGSMNRDFRTGTTAQANCIGSACAAWRTLPNSLVVRNSETGAERIVGPGEGYVLSRDIPVREVPTDHGYCGLAGRPTP